MSVCVFLCRRACLCVCVCERDGGGGGGGGCHRCILECLCVYGENHVYSLSFRPDITPLVDGAFNTSLFTMLLLLLMFNLL